MDIKLSHFVIEEDDFLRMQETSHGLLREWVSDMTFQEFDIWNYQCINELSDEDKTWLTRLCSHIISDRLVLQDMATCERLSADKFYFDYDKKFVIVNPE
jgi:hypothetical protein